MERNTTASRAGGLLLLTIAIIGMAILALYFLEYLLWGGLILALGVLVVVAIILMVGILLIIPMYVLKDTPVESGFYDIGSNDPVENEAGEGHDSFGPK